MSHSIHDKKHRGSIHDVKRKKVPLETKTGHFRTWKSGKKWIYGAAVLSLTAGTVAPIGNLAFLPKVEIANATTVTTALTPGGAVNTGDYIVGNNTVAQSTSSTYKVWQSASTATFPSTVLQNNTAGTYTDWTGAGNTSGKYSAALISNNGKALDMSQAMTFNVGVKTNASMALATATTAVGGYSGIIMMPASTTSLSSYVPSTLNGVKNAFFFGRPFNNAVAIGSTAGTGSTNINNFIISSTEATTIPTVRNVGTVGIASSGLGYSPIGDIVSVSWAPTAGSLNAANSTVSGTFTLTVTGGGNGTTTTSNITYAVTNIPRNMVVGAQEATGNGASTLSLNVQDLTKGTTAAEPVNVQYYNSVTNQPLAPNGTAWATTPITAPLGDTVGLLTSSTGTGSNQYDYPIPAAPAGYTIKGVSSALTSGGATTTNAGNTVQNFDSGATNPNNLYAYYTPNSQTATFNYGYDPSALNTPAAPAAQTATGTTDGAVTAPTFTVPTGYYIKNIYAGTSATGSPLNSTPGTSGTPAKFPSGQTYASSGNQYYVQLAPNTVRVHWQIAVPSGPDPDSLDSLGFPYPNYLVGQTTPNLQTNLMNDISNNFVNLTTTDNVVYTDTNGVHYVITGYSISGKTYPTFAALSAANRYVPVGANNNQTQAVTVNMVSDQTSITSQATTITTPFTPATNYLPSSDIMTGTDIDDADDDGNPAVVNGYDVVYNITGGNLNLTNLWGDSAQSLQLSTGSYTETYYALNYMGVQAYQTWLSGHAGGTVAQFLQSLPHSADPTNPTAGTLEYDTVSSQTTLNVADGTAITAQASDSIPTTKGLTLSSEVTSTTSSDSSAASNTTVNGQPVGVIMTGPGGYSYLGNAEDTIAANTLAQGQYTINYYALTAQGVSDYQTWLADHPNGTVGDFINSLSVDQILVDAKVATTLLDVTDFILPFTGGEGLAMIGGISALAFIAAVALYATKRKKTEEES